MRIAVISDIHSNLPALQAVKREIRILRPDSVVCAGDVVGYGASPNECCREVADLAQNVCLGNHDLAALTKDSTGMNPYASHAAKWTAEQLDDSARTFLEGLAESARVHVDSIQCGIRHGSLRSIWEYLYEEDISEDLLEETSDDALIFGHTHAPYVKKFERGIVLNPGSVGQPRDGDPRASFAVLETDPLRAETRRVEYDIKAAAEAILGAGLPRMLADRLSQGF